MSDWLIAFISVWGLGVLLVTILIIAGRKSEDKTNHIENNRL
jgi:hypothetical protein